MRKVHEAILGILIVVVALPVMVASGFLALFDLPSA